VDSAVKGIPKGMQFDIFGTHEPVAAKELLKDLPGQIRENVAGHLHAQNAENTVQTGNEINLVEGSTGAGGLDAMNSNPPPVEFSIESVAANCQFSKIVRFQLTGVVTAADTTSSTYGQHVTASTIYFQPQDVPAVRLCQTSEGISSVRNLGTTAG
jgi:hypothetical protein